MFTRPHLFGYLAVLLAVLVMGLIVVNARGDRQPSPPLVPSKLEMDSPGLLRRPFVRPAEGGRWMRYDPRSDELLFDVLRPVPSDSERRESPKLDRAWPPAMGTLPTPLVHDGQVLTIDEAELLMREHGLLRFPEEDDPALARTPLCLHVDHHQSFDWCALIIQLGAQRGIGIYKFGFITRRIATPLKQIFHYLPVDTLTNDEVVTEDDEESAPALRIELFEGKTYRTDEGPHSTHVRVSSRDKPLALYAKGNGFELHDAVRSFRGQPPESPAIICVKPGVPHQAVINILDILSYRDVQFAFEGEMSLGRLRRRLTKEESKREKR